MFKSTISACIVGLVGISSTTFALDKRQYMGAAEGGLPGVEGMNTRYSSPFAAFWNQGLVPGQGFPQIGMSSYGYGLPGLGLTQFINPDAQILKGVGEGEITENDLKNLENNVNGYDRFKEPSYNNVHQQPDPAFPGHFKNEDYNDEDDNGGHDGRYHHKHDDHNGAQHAAQLSSGVALGAISLAVASYFVALV
ncbi:hypothetical protein FB645_004962 [Coemansia sp. IMI 203386]|nr:hypothetical protein FB645_004962 [Coemansia sp. IMI 203386]